MAITDERLFYRISSPCANKFVSRGQITKEQANEIIFSLRDGRELPSYLDTMFLYAKESLRRHALTMGKRNIGRDVMLDYFTSGDHRKSIDAIYKIYPDFSKEECMARVGKIGGIVRDNVVAAASEPHVYKNTFLLDLKLDDYVLVHAGSVVEKLTEKEARKYLRS